MNLRELAKIKNLLEDLQKDNYDITVHNYGVCAGEWMPVPYVYFTFSIDISCYSIALSDQNENLYITYNTMNNEYKDLVGSYKKAMEIYRKVRQVLDNKD